MQKLTYSTELGRQGDYVHRLKIAAVFSLAALSAHCEEDRDISAPDASAVESKFTQPGALPQKKDKPPFSRFVKEGGHSGVNEVMEEAEGLRWTGRMKGNGGREVAIYVPHAIKSEEDTELIYYFHGGGGDHIPTKGAFPSRSKKKKVEGTDTYKLRTGRNHFEQALDATHAMDKNVVLVHPMSAGARGVPGVPYDEKWMKPSLSGEGFLAMHQEGLQVLREKLKVELDPKWTLITLKAHSAGGIALRNIMQNPHPPIDRIDFLDSSYSDWALDTYQSVNQRRQLIFNVLMAVNRDFRSGKGTDKTTDDLQQVHREEQRAHLNIHRAPNTFHGQITCSYFDWKPGKPAEKCRDPFFGTDDGERFFIRNQGSMFKHPEHKRKNGY